MNKNTKEQLIAYLLSFVSPARQEKMAQVLNSRTSHVTLIMEDIYQAHNANAVVRSVECFGVQHLHVVEDQHKFASAPAISRGATQWINLHHHKTMENAFDALRAQGYRIVATTPHKKAYSLFDLPLDKKLALVFGTEVTGLTDYAMEQADEFVTIPMVGFTESFNVSVSVALCLQHITHALHNSAINWRLSEEEKVDVMLSWLRETVQHADALEKRFLS